MKRKHGNARVNALRAATAVCLSAVLTLGLCGCGFSYKGDALDTYVTIDRDAVRQLSVTLPSDYKVTDEDVEAYIAARLLENKVAVADGAEETEKAAEYGDVIAFYYSGVFTDGDGTERVVSDGFKVGETPYLLELGAGGFPYAGVAELLTGVVPSEYAMKTNGTLSSETILYVEYSYHDVIGGEAGAEVYSNALRRVEMQAPPADLGDAFVTALAGADIGTWESVTLPLGEVGDARLYSVRIRYAATAELCLTTTVPDGKDGAGEEMRMYLQPVHMVDYEVPTLTAQTVTEVLKQCAGADDPVAAYRAYVREVLERDETRQNALREQIWTALTPLVTYGELPKSKVKSIRGILEQDMEELYLYCKENLYDDCVSMYGDAAMQSVGTFTVAVYGEEAGQNSRDILTREAETTVKSDLLIYILARECGFAPTEEVLTAGVTKVMDEYKTETGLTEKQLLRRYDGREYFEALYLYEYVMDALCGMVTVLYE